MGRLLLAHCMHTRCRLTTAMEEARERRQEEEEEEGDNGDDVDASSAAMRALREAAEMAHGPAPPVERVKFLLSVAGAHANVRMVSLLRAFRFARLRMRHPESGEPWLDEAGSVLLLMCRSGPLRVDAATDLLAVRKQDQQRVDREARTRKRSQVRRLASTPSGGRRRVRSSTRDGRKRRVRRRRGGG